MFHSQRSAEGRSATLSSLVSSVGGLIGFIGVVVDNQWSYQIQVVLPSPMVLPKLVTSKSLPNTMLLHPWEAEDGGLHSTKESFWQYFPSSTLAIKHDGLLSTFQLCFVKRASLNLCISRKPNPLSFFRRANFYQNTQHIFFFLGFGSHQNFVRMDWIRLYRLIGSWKQDIA